jgi:hypothetical protein
MAQTNVAQARGVLEVRRILAEAAMLKKTAEAATAQYDAKAKELVDAYRHAGFKTLDLPLHDGGDIRGTLVEGQRTKIDDAGLLVVLSPEQVEKVTKRVFDKDLLEAAVAVGVIDADLVAAHSTIVDVKPYVKITGSFTPETAEVAAQVAIRDAAGQSKPAARRVKPKGK